MKICTVVCNSVWFDPRVNKQIASYRKEKDVELFCVGTKCRRYDKEKIDAMKLPVTIVETPGKYSSFKRMKTPFGKIKREIIKNELIEKAIVAYNPDIIHANDLDAFIPAMKAAKKLHCRVIYDSHEIYVENHHIAANKLYSKLLRIVEARLVKKCDKMVSVSHSAAEYFSKTYNIEKPMVITNCVSKVQNNLKDKTDGIFEVLNHGQFMVARGYDLMANACDLFKDYPDIKLSIRGLGAYEKNIREIVEKSENKENFIIYPPVTVQELIPMASKSHVGVAITEPVCLNFKLSVSNKLFEYAAAGLPVIMSDIPEHRYLNEKYDFGIIIPENTPKAFADAVKRLYDDKELYNRLSENAKKLSMEVNWENEFEKLLEFERSLVNEKK